MSNMGYFTGSNGATHLDAVRFAKYARVAFKLICVDKEMFYAYINGVFVYIPIQCLKSKLYRVIDSVYNVWNLYIEDMYMKALERECHYTGELNPKKYLINLENCMFHTIKFKVGTHQAKYFSTVQLPIEYDESAKCDTFIKFLHDIFLNDEELINLVQEIVGYCLTTDVKAQSFFIFFGSGANGKSVLCNIIKKLIGKGNYSALSIADLANSFSRADLKDKLLNISAENESVNNRPFNSQYVKSISGGDEIKAEFKGKDVFTFQPFCKLIFAVNSLPNFNDKTDGFIRRIKIIPFNATFSIDDGTADVNIEAKLTKELSGIFNWAIEGLKRLRDNDYRFSKCVAAERAFSDYYETINPYILFWEECIDYNPQSDTVVSKNDVYRAFINWCKSNNHINLSRATPKKFWYDFNALIKQQKLTPLKPKKSNGKRYVIGITLKNYAPRCGIYHETSTPDVEEELDCGDIDYLLEL